MKKTKITKLTAAEKAFNIFYLLSPIIVILICYIKNL